MKMPQQRVIPALWITNYERSKTYYVEKLGFGVEWEHRFEPRFPVFMSVVRDGMRQCDAAVLMGVSPSLVSLIVSGRRWPEVSDDTFPTQTTN